MAVSSSLLSGCFFRPEAQVNLSQSEELPLSFQAKNTRLVSQTQVRSLDFDKPSIAPDASVSESIQVAITVDRDSLLTQEFLYGADLQYSSSYSDRLDLYEQSMAIGHIPARFRIVGRELQLVADQKRLYPSAVNHPEQLLSRYKILGQTEAIPATETTPAQPATLTISEANSGIILAQLFAGATVGSPNGSLHNPTAKPPRDLWTRSFEYIQNGNYLLQETSILLSDGTIAEFMESVFPRNTLKPKKDFQVFTMNPGDPIGSEMGSQKRFRLLAGEVNYNGERPVAHAQHFDITPDEDGSGGTIDYYVTRNIPDEFLEPVQLAVEGWNRYFEKMQGISRKVMQFKGRLPEGIKLGDPRYNVINWDNRRVAGAAYESQASDPSTGKQSHSLIYMPAAWVSIGKKYWENGFFLEPAHPSTPLLKTDFTQALKTDLVVMDSPEPSVSAEGLGQLGGTARSARVACLRSVKEISGVMDSGRLHPEEAEIFGLQLLKQTLFHEVGHALGLAHNFKGSLNFDRSKPDALFSTSIMDYNDYEVERQVFDALDSPQGPLLEYDRQIMSTLYNQGRDILESDPILPACADAEADHEVGGVDPLCNRYDLEVDPTLSINTAFNRVTQKTLEGDVTLPEALHRIAKAATETSVIESIQTDTDLVRMLAKTAFAITGSLRFYFLTGKTSISAVTRMNTKSLLMFEAGVLPANYNEEAMRTRAFEGILNSIGLRKLPPLITETLNEIHEQILTALFQSPLLKSKSMIEQFQTLLEVKVALDQIGPSFESNLSSGLPQVRATALAAIRRHPRVPFFLGKIGKQDFDFEVAMIRLLSQTVMDTTRTPVERVTAASSLASFKGRLSSGDQAIKNARDTMTRERNEAKTNSDREVTELILALLKN